MRGVCVVISVLLSFAYIVYGLKCHYCVREKLHQGCVKKVSECTPPPGNACIAIMVYYKGVLQFRMEGCAYKLGFCKREIINRRIGYNVNVSCCASHDFCNHWDSEEDD